MPDPRPISILAFADSVLGIQPYPWQCKILLNYEAGNRVAVAASNFTGKTSVIFPICALWTLYCHPRARIQYISATHQQIKIHFFGALERFKHLPAFHGWTWLETEIRTPEGGRIFARSTDSGGSIEGLHDTPGSPAALLVDEAKSVSDDVLNALDRGYSRFRLFASSTGPALGEFYRIMTAKSHLWQCFTVPSSMCPHVDPVIIEADRQDLLDPVFRIKHGAQWLFDAGQSLISLEHVRDLQRNPPMHVDGQLVGGCDFAHSDQGDDSAFALCDGNCAIMESGWRWKTKDSTHSIGKFIAIFREEGLLGHQVAGDEGGAGHVIMDSLQEEGYFLKRVRNNDPANNSADFVNLAAEQWTKVAQLIQKRLIHFEFDPQISEKLIEQLTSRKKLYDQKGRTKLEPKSEMAGRSPDLADALVLAVCMGFGANPYAAYPKTRAHFNKGLRMVTQHMDQHKSPFAVPFINFDKWF